MIRKGDLRRVMGFLLLWSATAVALGQGFPNRPLRVIMPYPPTGPDVINRPIAKHMSETLGKPIVYENRGGGGGIPAILEMMNAPADGHVMVVVDSGHWGVSPVVRQDLPYSPLRDFAPIGHVLNNSGLLIFTLSTAPYKDLRELIAHARANPNTVQFGVGGFAGYQHLAGEALKLATGSDMQAVVYKAGAEVITAVLRGEVTFGYSGYAGLTSNVAAGKLKLLAIITKNRNKYLPEIPTVGEALDLPDYYFPSQSGFVARAGTPAPVVRALSSALLRAIAQPDVQEIAQKVGYELVSGRPEEMTELIKGDLKRYAQVVKLTGIKAE